MHVSVANLANGYLDNLSTSVEIQALERVLAVIVSLRKLPHLYHTRAHPSQEAHTVVSPILWRPIANIHSSLQWTCRGPNPK